MKKIFYLLPLIFALNCNAQANIQWVFSAKKLSNNIAEVHLKGILQAPWHIYSQYMNEGGPIPTKIVFVHDSSIVLLGKTKEVGSVVNKKEEVFDITVRYYEGSVDFVQKMKINPSIHSINGIIEYMICETTHCMPPVKAKFSIPL